MGVREIENGIPKIHAKRVGGITTTNIPRAAAGEPGAGNGVT